MIWLLIALLSSGILTHIAYKSADRPGDDFGAAIPALFGMLVTGILGITYLGLAFWLHRWI